MNNTARWTLFGLLVVVNVAAGSLFNGTWQQIVISSLTGAGMLALVIEYLVRGRRGGR